jgi:hypothetical protein
MMDKEADVNQQYKQWPQGSMATVTLEITYCAAVTYLAPFSSFPHHIRILYIIHLEVSLFLVDFIYILVLGSHKKIERVQGFPIDPTWTQRPQNSHIPIEGFTRYNW